MKDARRFCPATRRWSNSTPPGQDHQYPFSPSSKAITRRARSRTGRRCRWWCDAEQRGTIQPGDTLIEATSGNTGIALSPWPRRCAVTAWCSSCPSTCQRSGARAVMSLWRRTSYLRHRQAAWKARVTWPRKWPRQQGEGDPRISLPIRTIRSRTTKPPGRKSGATPTEKLPTSLAPVGTTGTIMGVSRFLKEKPEDTDRGLPADRGFADSRHPCNGPKPTCRASYDAKRVDRVLDVTPARRRGDDAGLAREEGIFAGISSGGAVHAALKLSRRN